MKGAKSEREGYREERDDVVKAPSPRSCPICDTGDGTP